jgi:hypothetical protein
MIVATALCSHAEVKLGAIFKQWVWGPHLQSRPAEEKPGPYDQGSWNGMRAQLTWPSPELLEFPFGSINSKWNVPAIFLREGSMVSGCV